MIINGLFGLRFEPTGVRFDPCVPAAIEKAELTGLQWRGAYLDLVLRGQGPMRSCRVDGVRREEPFLPSDGREHWVEIECAP